jgi:hypothetical protein
VTINFSRRTLLSAVGHALTCLLSLSIPQTPNANGNTISTLPQISAMLKLQNFMFLHGGSDILWNIGILPRTKAEPHKSVYIMNNTVLQFWELVQDFCI